MGLCDKCPIKDRQDARCGFCQSKDDFDMAVTERAGIDSKYFKMHLEAVPGNSKGVLQARDTFGEVEFIIEKTELKRFIERVRELFGWEI